MIGTRLASCVAAITLAVGGMGCAAETASETFTTSDIVDQTPKGKVNGAEWTMVSAVVSIDHFDENELSVHLFNTEVAECDSYALPDPMIMFTTSREPGEKALSFSAGQTLTFVTGPAQNVISLEGLIHIESLSDTEVTMGIVAKAGDGNEINGRFTAPLCGHEN